MIAGSICDVAAGGAEEAREADPARVDRSTDLVAISAANLEDQRVD